MLVNFLNKASHAIFFYLCNSIISSAVFDDNPTTLFKFDDRIDFSFVIHLWLFVDCMEWGWGGGEEMPI